MSTTKANIDGQKITVSTWRFSHKEPYVDRPTPYGDAGKDKHWVFKCHTKGCGHDEFEGLGGGSIQCNNCTTEYIMGWS